MASQFEIDCALMAGVAYRSTRKDINRFPIPTDSGWNEISGSHRNLPSGFEAVSFERSSANDKEIVISFAGTYPSDIFGDVLQVDWGQVLLFACRLRPADLSPSFSLCRVELPPKSLVHQSELSGVD
jgi:hypothetical protein